MTQQTLNSAAVAGTLIINWPLNQVVIIDDSVHFTCVSDNEEGDIWWHFYAPGANWPILISKGDKSRHENKHKIVNGTKGAQLLISSVESNDAGLYVCSEADRNRRGAQLLVKC